MATVDQVAREAVAAVNSDASTLLAAQWVARRYQQLCSRSRFRHLRHIGEVTLPGVIDDGTCTVTRGSRTVTGNAAAQAVWTPSVVGRYFRARVVWHRISAVVGGALRLESEFAESDVSAGAYKVVVRQVHLAPNVRWLSDKFVHGRFRREVSRVSLTELDLLAPERQLVGPPPNWWSEIGEDINEDGQKVKSVEFYPTPTDDELLYYVFWDIPPLLTMSNDIPSSIDPHVLREGALIDVMRYEMGKAARAGQVEQAGFWRNESRAQSTAWERNVIEAIRTDRGTDDVTFILQSIRQTGFGSDIINARDEIFARGARP